ncbi:MAG: LptF/LptG family permease [Planctomycetota bacterium]|jgi:lipopolysaccharide export LptBFGC system permease protein LptF
MPRRLYRYILGELLRVFFLSTAVLVTVIAFGAAVKPLTDDHLLSAAQAAKYIGLAIVPMLQFALPFAAGFAATTVLHRMSTDNEIQAMSAAGLSHSRIIVPIASLGIALTVVMVLLTQWVIPKFWVLMERTITADLTRMFQASIERGEPFEIGDLQIFADRLVVDRHPRDTEADTRFMLWRVAAAKLGEGGRPVTEVTAHQAVLDIYRRLGRTYLKLRLNDAVAFNSETGELVRTVDIGPERAIVVPSALKDDPRFMTQAELLELREAPDRFGRVIEARMALAHLLRDMVLRHEVDAHLRSHGELEMVELGPARRRCLIRADGLSEAGFFTFDGRPVEVVRYASDTPELRIRSGRAQLVRAAAAALGSPAFDVVLADNEVTDLEGGGQPNQRAELTLPNLELSGVSAEDLSQLTSEQLLHRSGAQGDVAPEVRSHAHRLEKELTDLGHEIPARLLKRYALSATAFLLLALGATLGMWFRDSLPLGVYLWSFLPAILGIVMISGGEQIMREGRMVAGSLVMWGGDAGLAVLLAIAFRQLARL